MNILGRERDFESGEFSLEFFFGRLGHDGQLAKILASLEELTKDIALAFIYESRPTNRNSSRFNFHKG